jgi:hypothetical protein
MIDASWFNHQGHEGSRSIRLQLAPKQIAANREAFLAKWKEIVR